MSIKERLESIHGTIDRIKEDLQKLVSKGM